jgi:hypothetical protein
MQLMNVSSSYQLCNTVMSKMSNIFIFCILFVVYDAASSSVVLNVWKILRDVNGFGCGPV